MNAVAIEATPGRRPLGLVRTDDAIRVVTAPSVCDLAAVPALACSLSSALASGSDAIVLDARTSRVVDDALPCLLARVHRQLAEQGARLAIVAPYDSPVEVSLWKSGWSDVLEVHPTPEAAVDAIRPSGPSTSDADLVGSLVVERHGNVTRVVLRGEWDISNVEQLAATLRRAGLDATPRVIVDLAAVSFVDLRVVACLRDARDAFAAAGGGLSVGRPRSEVLRTLELCGADDLVLRVAAASATLHGADQ